MAVRPALWLLATSPGIIADHWPTTDHQGRNCAPDQVYDAVPSFHVHIAYNGWNFPEHVQARRLLEAFAAFTNSSMCTFGHANCMAWVIENGTLISEGFDEICQLDPLKDFPINDAKGFSAASTAFYVPRSKLYEAEKWWRLNHEGVSFFFHACSGCEDLDHTEYAMFSHDYRFPITVEALLCCHDGPPGCYCDAFFIFRDSENRAIAANIQEFPNVTNDYTVSMQQLPNPEPDPSISFGDGKFLNCAWKVTYYRPDWSQLEVQGYTLFNTYQCLAASSCADGANLLTVDCRAPGLTRMHPHGQIIYVDDCPGMCIDAANTGAKLTPCSSRQIV